MADPPTKDWLGNRLRALYDGVLNEPVPRELQALAERINRASDEPERRDPVVDHVVQAKRSG